MDSPDNSPDPHTQTSDTQICQLGQKGLLWGAGWRSRFRYRLFEGDRLLWERWAPDGERYAQDIYLDDSGWVVLLTDGERYQVLQAVSPDGQEATPVAITDDDAKPPSEVAPAHLPRVTFDVSCCSTAGMYFQQRTLSFFVKSGGLHYFWLLMPNGQRVVLSLDESRLLDSLPDSLELALVQAEAAEARRILRLPPQETDPDRLPVIASAIRQGLVDLLPQLECRREDPMVV